MGATLAMPPLVLSFSPALFLFTPFCGSFMGANDPHGGKYYVPNPLVPTFLREAHEAMRRGAKLCLSENYNKRSYRRARKRERERKGRRRRGAARAGSGCFLFSAGANQAYPGARL